MWNKVCDSFDKAISDMTDGCTIMFGGFGRPGVPRNLIDALIRRGTKDLTIISNNPGVPSAGITDLEDLVVAGRVKKAICTFTASPHPSRTTPFERLYNEGKAEGELVPQGTLAERIRAAGAGVGAFYTRSGVGTELAIGKEHRTINGKEYILEYPLHADYAFIRGYRSDTFGNIQYRLAQRNFNPLMAMAARITIAEIEEDIVAIGTIDPDQIHTSGIFVDRVVKIPTDGIWDLVAPV